MFVVGSLRVFLMWLIYQAVNIRRHCVFKCITIHFLLFFVPACLCWSVYPLTASCEVQV